MPKAAKPESIDDETGFVRATKPLIVYEDDLDEHDTIKIPDEAQPDSIGVVEDPDPVEIQLD